MATHILGKINIGSHSHPGIYSWQSSIDAKSAVTIYIFVIYLDLPGPAEAKLNWSSRLRAACISTQQLGGFLGGMPPKKIFLKFDALRSLLGPFLDPSSALSVALGRLRQYSDYKSATQPSGYM